MKKIIVICGVVFTSITVALIVSVRNQEEAEVRKHFVQQELAEVKRDLQLWESIPSGPEDAKRHLAKSILTRIILIEKFEPSISDLSSSALESLCLIIESSHIFKYVKNDEVVELAVHYLSSIREEVQDYGGFAPDEDGSMKCKVPIPPPFKDGLFQ